MKRLLALLFTCALIGAGGWLVTHRPKASPAPAQISFANRIDVEVQPQAR